MTEKKLPSTFERILLSHLTVLAAAFVAVIWLYFYLVEPSLRLYFRHSTIIIVPISLILIGIAGLLTTWTAKTIVSPIEKMTDALKKNEEMNFDGDLDEIQTLIRQVKTNLGNVPHPDRNSTTEFTEINTDQYFDQLKEFSTEMKQSISALAIFIDDVIPRIEDHDMIQSLEQMKEQIIRLTIISNRMNTLRLSYENLRRK